MISLPVLYPQVAISELAFGERTTATQPLFIITANSDGTSFAIAENMDRLGGYANRTAGLSVTRWTAAAAVAKPDDAKQQAMQGVEEEEEHKQAAATTGAVAAAAAASAELPSMMLEISDSFPPLDTRTRGTPSACVRSGASSRVGSVNSYTHSLICLCLCFACAQSLPPRLV
jgi:hypothetical protein